MGGGLVASDLCPKRRIRVLKKLKRVPKKEKEVTYIFYLFKWGVVLDLIYFFEAHRFWRPDLVELLAHPKAGPGLQLLVNYNGFYTYSRIYTFSALCFQYCFVITKVLFT